MQITSTVVDILKLGLSGLVFLLMYLGFRLLAQERGKRSPNTELLRHASLFVWQSILIAFLVAAVELTHRFIERDPSPAQQFAVCLEELESLNQVSIHSEQTVDTLRSAIRNTWTVCGHPGK